MQRFRRLPEVEFEREVSVTIPSTANLSRHALGPLRPSPSGYRLLNRLPIRARYYRVLRFTVARDSTGS